LTCRATTLAVIALLTVVGDPLRALAQDSIPPELEGIGIDELPGAQVSGDVTLTNQDGRTVRLSDYFDGRRPVVLVLAYYSCPMLCTLVLNGLSDAVRGLPFGAGDRFRIVTASVDPRDTVEIASQKRENYVKALGRPVSTDGWDFLVGDASQSKRLADAMGFHYRWDERQQQYAHAAGIFVLTPEGRLSRVLYGVQFEPRDLRLAVLEAGAGRITTAWERVVLFCFHYDPAGKGYAVAALRLMRAGGAVVALSLGTWLVLLWRRTARMRRAAEAGGTAT